MRNIVRPRRAVHWAIPCLAFVTLAVSAGAASASPFSVTTTGTITTGSDSANLLGAGTNLAGDAYTLTLNFKGLGAGYFTDGSGQFALDTGDAIPGSVTVTINGHTTTTVLSANVDSSLDEDTSDLSASNSGLDATGTFASGSQSIYAASNFAPFADLQTDFSYALTAADFGSATYSFSNSANTHTASFSATVANVQFTVPEPASLALLGAGLLGVVFGRRRTAI